MADEGPTTVGSINARLTLDGDQFEREARRAEETADRLDGRDVTVHAHADTAAAVAGLDRVQLATDRVRLAQMRLDEVNGRANATDRQRLSAQVGLSQATQRLRAEQARAAASTEDSADATDRHTHSLKAFLKELGGNITALQGFIAASPLALAGAATIAAGATGLAVAFGVMAGAGVAAIVGIKHEMEQGTVTGQVYANGLSSMKVGLDALEQTGAQHFLDGFATSVETVNRYMPFLNGLVATGADALGNMTSTLTGGLLQGLERMQPLIQAGTTALSQFVGWISGMSATNGFTEFVSYATANLPSVIQLVESLVTLAGRIVAAFAPIGPVVVGALQGITDVLNALPLPVLAGLVTAAVGIPVAFSIARAAVATFGETAALQALNVTLFGTAINLAVPVVGVLTALLAGLGMAFATAAASQQQAVPVAQEYASALERDGNAIGKYTTQLAVKNLAEAGAYDAVSKLGLGTDVLTKAVTGNADAYRIIQDRISEVDGAYDKAAKNSAASGLKMTQSVMDQKAAADALMPSLDGNLKAIQAQQHANEQADAALQGKSQAERDAAAAEAQHNADILGTTVPAINAATDAQHKTADAANAATLKFQMENDAASILKGALDALNGKALSAAQAQNAFDSSLANMGDHVDKTGKQITFTTTSIGDMSAASVALRGQLNGQVANLEAVAEANGGMANATGKARDQMITMRQQIIDNAVAHGVDRDAVTAYIDKILQIPASVPPTKVEADTAAAEAALIRVQSLIAGIQSKTVTITTVNTGAGEGAPGTAGGGMVHANALGGFAGSGLAYAYRALGGSMHPASRGTDMIPTMLSRGEFVTRQSSVASIERAAPGAMDYMNRTGQLLTQQAPGPAVVQPVIHVYVGGDELDARTVRVVQGELAQAARAFTRTRIGA